MQLGKCVGGASNEHSLSCDAWLLDILTEMFIGSVVQYCLSLPRSGPTMPLPVALQTRLAKRGILKHLEPGEKASNRWVYRVPVLPDVCCSVL